MRFGKPAVSISDQIELLKRRGVAIKRMRDIIFSSSHIIGSRLIGHFLAVHAEVDEDHALPESTSFNDVLTLYTFDRELRLLVLDAIERVDGSSLGLF